MSDMAPWLEFGGGIAAGVLVTLLVIWGIRARRRRQTFTGADSAATLAVAEQVLEELAGSALIVNEWGMPIFANEVSKENDGPTGLDRQLRSPDFQKTVFEVLSTGESVTREPEEADSIDAVRLHIFRLDDYHVVVLADDLGEAQRVNVMRRDFIANMSHELKTPIAAIGLLSEALQEAADDPEVVRNFAQRLRRETARLSELSRDVIRLSEAQSHLPEEDREKIELRDLVQREVERHTEYALQRGVTLQISDNTRRKQVVHILGRRSALGVAVSNLLSNAITHSPEAGVVDVALDSDGEVMTVVVSDQGEGIDPQHQPRIFERFYRLDRARSRDDGGTGLGLSIVRHTMRAHEGDVSVQSVPGEGASFTLTFPVYTSQPARKKKKTAMQKSDKVKKPTKSTKEVRP